MVEMGLLRFGNLIMALKRKFWTFNILLGISLNKWSCEVRPQRIYSISQISDPLYVPKGQLQNFSVELNARVHEYIWTKWYGAYVTVRFITTVSHTNLYHFIKFSRYIEYHITNRPEVALGWDFFGIPWTWDFFSSKNPLSRKILTPAIRIFRAKSQNIPKPSLRLLIWLFFGLV